MSVLLLELNEINFDYVRRYVDRGELPNLGKLLSDFPLIETTSEQDYEHLEPWVQWVTAHTGLTFEEHQVFRLGDIIGRDIRQIWEALEEQGVRVGAVSPMNANNRCRDAAFFVPDPWTPTHVTGSPLMKRLHLAITQAVNDNSQARLKPSSAAWLVAGLGAYARPVNYGVYTSLVAGAARGNSWARALILDQLLADIFIRAVKSERAQFASLFLNAGAHIQHHYMFNSRVYEGPHANPNWYVNTAADPVLDVYRMYDRIVGQVRTAFPQARLILATGLHQDPYPDLTFYWRLKDHAAFLTKAGVPFERVEPRMSRDFVIYCRDDTEALQAEQRLLRIKAPNGTPLFEVDNRGSSVFVMLVWADDIPADFVYLADNTPLTGLRDDVAFVAIKNGGHNGIGYLLDTGRAEGEPSQVPLASMPERIAAACGVRW